MADDVENHTLRLLQEMRAEMREGFTRVDERLIAVEQRLTGVELHATGVEQRLTGVEQRLTGVELRLTGVEQRLDVLEGTVSKVIGAVTEIAKVQETHSTVFAELVESEPDRWGAPQYRRSAAWTDRKASWPCAGLVAARPAAIKPIRVFCARPIYRTRRTFGAGGGEAPYALT